MADDIFDPRVRLRVSAQLWSCCISVVTTAGVLRIADIVDKQLDDECDALEVIRLEVEAAGVPPNRIAHVALLVLIVLTEKGCARVSPD